MNVVGRLAPTPSGLLHIGNARSFLLAWLWARSEGGKVIMRVEDIDLPRCKPEYREQALSDIAWLGLDWDEGPQAGDAVGKFDQHTRVDIYRQHLQTLIDKGLAYPCTCSRKDIREASSAPHGEEGAIYPGTCRGKYQSAEQALSASGREPAWRFKFEGEWTFADSVAGETSLDASILGDFVLWRRDDLPSYQLAVTVDDAQMGVTQVLRGRDLRVSTYRQLALYEALGLNPPSDWANVPFLQDETGRRMAKRDGDLSMKSLREAGVDASRLVGLLAWSAGLQGELKPVSANDLIGNFKVSAISRQDFAFQQEHLNWLKI
ncbi:MAG: tRNA glutamyl-Q(34) synthetase GluQRS [Planctomycetes bacterium]|nr:tRNA glutamyl-Q(34) synthetase GluQRS [Planctomycetota bacterium]